MALLIANRDAKLAKFWENSGYQEDTGNVAEMGHFNSMLAREMGYRQKCQIPQYFTRISGKSRPIHLPQKNGPVWYLIADRIRPNFETNRALMTRHGMLRKIGHFNSRFAFKMGLVGNAKFPRVLPKFWENHGQSICIRKWPPFIANRCSKLAKFRGRSGHRERIGNVASNLPF